MEIEVNEIAHFNVAHRSFQGRIAVVAILALEEILWTGRLGITLTGPLTEAAADVVTTEGSK
jgi:hypothetical protein